MAETPKNLKEKNLNLFNLDVRAHSIKFLFALNKLLARMCDNNVKEQELKVA